MTCCRTDNGEEYMSKAFDDYCSKHGVRHEKTVPGTLQHNAVAERISCTIVEKISNMLRMTGLPKSVWGKTVWMTCCLINQSLSISLAFEIPEKVWSHLKVFGCKVFPQTKLGEGYVEIDEFFTEELTLIS